MRRIEWLWGRKPRSGNAATVAIGGLGLAVVVGALWMVRSQTAAPAAPVNVPTVSVPVVAPVVSAAPVAPIAEPVVAPVVELTLAERVLGHLDAGEFGPAFDAAQSAAEPAEQAALLRQVAQAQLAAGEFRAAKQTLAQLPLGFGDSEDTQATNLDTSLAGGTGADFTQLIELIQSETGNEDYGPWLDVHGTGGTMSQFDSGVRVDPNGVLALASKSAVDGRLASISRQAREAALNQDMAQPSELRMVSLTRLEQAIADRLAAGKPVVESMRQLAGLSQIQYVFVYPEEREIVIAGPAEGWKYNE